MTLIRVLKQLLTRSMPGAARRLTNRQHHSRNPTVRRPNRLRNRWVLSDVALFAIPRESGWYKFTQSFTPGSCLPFAGCVTRLAPSPCARLSRARSTMSQSDSPPTFSLPPFAVGAAYLHKFDLDSGLPQCPGFPSRGSLSVGLIVPQELMGPLKFSTLLLLHARRSDPDRPSSISPNRRLRMGFRLVNNVATCFGAFNEAHFASGWCGHPSGLQAYSVYASPLLFACARSSLPQPPLRQRRKTR
jgi:hypothetical protein